MVADPESIPWLTFGSEEHRWDRDIPDYVSHRQRLLMRGPYRSAIPTEIANLPVSLPGGIAADAEEAAAELSRFDAHAAAMLGETAQLGPMASILLRTESASSSQIENLTVSAKQLALAALGSSSSVNARTVLGNVAAMEAALRLSSELSESAILQTHRALLGAVPGWEDHAGSWRQELVWIGRSSASPHGASHVAPQADLVPAAIVDLVAFMNRVDIPVITHAAIAHAQFENIHPFSDGNGRTGRVLLHAMIRNRGVTRTMTAPVSSGLLTDTNGYFDALTAFREGDAAPIVVRLAEASLFAATQGTVLIHDLAEAVDAAHERSSARRDSLARRVIPILVQQPVVDSRFLQHYFEVTSVDAARALSRLEADGILTETSGKGRNRVWEFRPALAALSTFADTIRRSTPHG